MTWLEHYEVINTSNFFSSLEDFRNWLGLNFMDNNTLKICGFFNSGFSPLEFKKLLLCLIIRKYIWFCDKRF